MNPLIRKPSAWVPIVLSLVVLALILGAITLFGPPQRQSDEGTAAHLFQLWLEAEALMVLFFALTWLPQAPKQAILILLVQIAAILAACSPVFYFKL